MALEMKSKKVVIDDRFLTQQARQAIRGDILRALVELITNSDDSYRNLEAKNEKLNGKIIVEFNRQSSDKYLIVRDYAEGMSLDKLVTVTGEYGGATSSIYEVGGPATRGIFGRGLKDTIMGLGNGEITSFHNGFFSQVFLNQKNNSWHVFFPSEATPVTKKHLNEWGIGPRKKHSLAPHATIVKIKISKSVKVPRFNTLCNGLQQHFSLRSIVNNTNRSVTLRQVRIQGNRKKIVKEKEISYKYPQGKIVLDKNIKTKNTNINVDLIIYRCFVKLDTPNDSGPLANGGIVIEAGNIPLALTLCGEEGHPNAGWFWGRAKCDKILDRAKKDNSIISATRDGLNWDHGFNKEIREVIRKELKKLIKIEDKRTQDIKKKEISRELQIKNNKALNELNKIAKKELEKLLSGTLKIDDVSEDNSPLLPVGGFGFIPNIAHIFYNKETYILLRAKMPEVVNAGDKINIYCDNQNIQVKNKTVQLEPRDDYPSIGEAKIILKGTKIGVQGEVVAKLKDVKTRALVEVIIKKERTESKQRLKKKGLFKDISFDPESPPEQRVIFRNGIIIIATKAPSVKLYFEVNGGIKDNDKSYVFLAELISDAMCTYIAQEKINKGDQLILGTGNPLNDLQFQRYQLQAKYAHIIHKIYADKERLVSENSNMAQPV